MDFGVPERLVAAKPGEGGRWDGATEEFQNFQFGHGLQRQVIQSGTVDIQMCEIPAAVEKGDVTFIQRGANRIDQFQGQAAGRKVFDFCDDDMGVLSLPDFHTSLLGEDGFRQFALVLWIDLLA